MTATATRAGILCDCCETPLTGGRDTYGGVGENLCFACYFTDPRERCETVTSAEKKAEARRKFLEKRLKQLKSWLVDAEADLAHAREQIGTYENRIADVERELTDGDRADEEQEDDDQ